MLPFCEEFAMRQRPFRLLIPFAVIVVLAAGLQGCAGAPPAGSPQRAAWEKEKQAEAAGAERSGQRNDVSDPVPVQVVK
jgi:hypothetical protein